ncbi:UNVERIFIED_CONTAM: hypothetical protein RMT77_000788 [Armadillidium vulgare]
MYLFIFVLFLYCGKECIGEIVSTAKVLENGYINTKLQPLEIDVKPPSGFEGNYDVTICFWLFPFRIFGSDSVFSIKPIKKMDSEIAFTLMEESVLISSSDCYFTMNNKPEFRTWTNFCLILSNSLDVYIDGKRHFTEKCNISKILQGSQYVNITIGRNSQTVVPYSGMIADFRFYFSKLKDKEILNVSKVLQTSVGYQNVLNISSSKRSFVVTDTIDSEELTKPPSSSVLLYISGINTYKNAEKVCEYRRGLLPDLDIHGMQNIVKLITNFQGKTGRTFNSFWLNKQNSSCLKGTFEAKKLNIRQSAELCNQTKINYFCILDRNVKFHLIGFDEEDPLFYPVPNSIGVFDSNSKYRLYFKNELFILKDLSENYTLYESERLTIGKLVGRHLWYKPSNYDLPKELTFSSCNYNEFTCSNGECINSQYVCQYEGECSDSSDEAFSICEVGIPPNPFYDATAPPSPHSTNISIQFELIRMADINMETSMMTLYFLFTLGWRDERLVFKFLKPNASVVVSKEIAEKYWHPEVLITEAADAEEAILSFEGSSISVRASKNSNGNLGVINSYRAKYYSGEDVDITSENFVNISIRCDMYLFFYPFDDQACSCTLLLTNEDQLPKVIWDKTMANVSLSLDFKLSIYDIEDFEYTFTKPEELQITWVLSRKYGAFILNTILPSIIGEMVSILALLLPTDESFNRLYATVSAATVIINLFTLITNSMPKSEEPKLIDIWMFIHMLISFFVLIGHIVVIVFDRAEREKRHDIFDFSFGQIFYKRRNKFEKPTNVKRFKEIASDNEKEIVNFNSKKLNRNFLIIALFFYGLFLLIFYLAAARYIDVLVGV